MRLSILSLLSSFGASLAKVIEATDADIDKYIDSGIPTLLSIHAPWCGHCKTFAPEFDELSEQYSHAKSEIQFVRIDGDANRKTSKKYNVEYFPTLKFVTGTKQENVNDRKIDFLQSLIKKKTGVSHHESGGSAPARDFVTHLTDVDLDEQLKGKTGFVAYTTTWCSHCKTLKPVWASLATLYSNDDDVVIGSVDCTEGAGKQLQKKHKIQGFPTIVYYPKDGSKPFAYAGGRNVRDFVNFLKDEGASERELTGFLASTAGTIKDLKKDSSNLIDATEEQAAAFVSKVEQSGSEFAAQYLKFIPKIREGGVSYIKKERKRLQKLIKSNVSHQTRDNIKVRMNILRSFLPSKEQDIKEEL